MILSKCTHIVSVVPELFFTIYGSSTINQAIRSRTLPCSKCSNTRDVWACLHPNCPFVGCGHNGDAHSLTHFQSYNKTTNSLSVSFSSASHSLAINLRTAVVWCFRCHSAVHCYELVDPLSKDILLKLRTVIINPRSLDGIYDPSKCEARAKQYKEALRRQQEALEKAKKAEKKQQKLKARKQKQEEVLEKRIAYRMTRIGDPLQAPPQNKTNWMTKVVNGGVFLRYLKDKAPQREYVYVDDDCNKLSWRDVRKPTARPQDCISFTDVVELNIGSQCVSAQALIKLLAAESRTQDQKEKLIKRGNFLICILTSVTELYLEAGSLISRNEWFLAFRFCVYKARKEAGLEVFEVKVPEEVAESLDGI
ncbi:hypothetical protein P9112_011948 [Eukaryota sp. TZLM1-RC]